MVFVLNVSIPWVFIFSKGVSRSSEFITESILLYIEGIFFHPPSVFVETSWASDLLSVIMLLHVSNWIVICCFISLVYAELGWVDGDGCGWGCGNRLKFASNFPIRSCLSYREIFLRLEPSTIAFRYICLTSLCFGNTIIQYRIWDLKDDSRGIAWVLSCLFPSVPYYAIVFFPSVSATSASVCSSACSLLIVVAPPVVWVGATVSCNLGSIVAHALVRVEIAACVGSKDFSAFTEDTAISWNVDELCSTIFYSMNGGNGA